MTTYALIVTVAFVASIGLNIWLGLWHRELRDRYESVVRRVDGYHRRLYGQNYRPRRDGLS